MPHESRQARRARERRVTHKGQPAGRTMNWSVAGALVVVLAALGVFAYFILQQGTKHTAAVAQTANLAKPIGNIHCDYSEMVGAGFYHVHAHLSLIDSGQPVTVPAQIGFATGNDCLYWVHTHSPSYGIIHIESPHKVVPTLGEFFKIWGRPLTQTQVGDTQVKPGQALKVWVNMKPYHGDPNAIKLYQHTDVTIEIGPKFVTPRRFNFSAYQV